MCNKGVMIFFVVIVLIITFFIFNMQEHTANVLSDLQFISGPIKDLGDVNAGSKQDIEFVLANTGTNKIRFDEKILTSCGCTSAVLDSLLLFPNQRTNLHLSLEVPYVHSFRQKVSTIIGVVEPTQQKIAVTVYYNSYLPWSVSPVLLRMAGSVGSISKETVRISKCRDDSMLIEKIDVSNNNMNILCSDFDNDGVCFLYLTYKQPEQPTTHNVKISIHTTGTTLPVQHIDVECVAMPLVKVIPNSIVLQHNDNSTILKRQISFISPDECKIQEVSSKTNMLSFHYDDKLSKEHTFFVFSKSKSENMKSYEKSYIIVKIKCANSIHNIKIPVTIINHFK